MGPALAAVDACAGLLPEVPQICAFDTAFHATMPEEARLYAVPPAWAEPLSLRRYGFHGLSVAYAVRRTEALLGALPPRIVVCHLGSGASVTAVREGRSADTSMGYTPLDGLVMATRPGHLDPGAVLALADHLGTRRGELEARLDDECGLLGLAGTADMREVLARADAGEPRARTAYGVFLTSLVRTVGAAVGVLGGLDVLVFTGGRRRALGARAAGAVPGVRLRRGGARPGPERGTRGRHGPGTGRGAGPSAAHRGPRGPQRARRRAAGTGEATGLSWTVGSHDTRLLLDGRSAGRAHFQLHAAAGPRSGEKGKRGSG